jgi:hypothetical protein
LLLLNFQSWRFESSAAHIAAILGRVAIVIGLVLVEIFDVQRRPVLSVGDLGKWHFLLRFGLLSPGIFNGKNWYWALEEPLGVLDFESP